MRLRLQLALKIQLEERFRREVRRMHNRIRNEYRISVATGGGIRAARYMSRWSVLLNHHYERVQRAFTGAIKGMADDEMLAALLAWADANSQEVAAVITHTVQTDLDNALIQARQALSDGGNFDYSMRELAAVVSVILRRRFIGRETSIIITETQRAAESTKLMDAYSSSGLQPMAVVDGRRTPSTGSRKSWVDVGDKDVRTGHHAHEVETVGIDEAFTVNGQQMLYPGDNSQGAAVGNTINCRCGSRYTIKEGT